MSTVVLKTVSAAFNTLKKFVREGSITHHHLVEALSYSEVQELANEVHWKQRLIDDMKSFDMKLKEEIAVLMQNLEDETKMAPSRPGPPPWQAYVQWQLRRLAPEHPRHKAAQYISEIAPYGSIPYVHLATLLKHPPQDEETVKLTSLQSLLKAEENKYTVEEHRGCFTIQKKK